jgi:hypothetical protein
MTTTALGIADGRPATAPAALGRDRRFYLLMGLAAAATVFAGFARTYFLKDLFGAPPLRPFLHLHGLLFSAWIVLFLVQTRLVAARRVDVHRKLGALGGLLAASMVVVGFLAAVGSARSGFAPPGGPPPLVFLAIPLFDLVVFAGLVGVALVFRRKPQVHKRLLLLATLGLLTPAIARLPFVGGPPEFFGYTDLFILACLVHDRVTHGRVHPALLWGAVCLVLSQPLRLVVAGTQSWLDFAGWLTR